MCGVVAIHAYASGAASVDRAELRNVRDSMAARGPDGLGEWFSPDERMGLGHRRLSIIDLSRHGAQPMASGDRQCVISFNGEIYNYRELRAQLQARGRVFATESDTEVLLQLYEEYGTGMLDKLRGMFAFALWDTRRQALLLARDPLGIKPLYYADNGKTIRVASQVKALLHSPVDTSPDPAGHAGFFLWGSVPGPWTLYRGIRNLAPGHFMWVRGERAEAPQPYCLVTDILAQAAAQPARGSEQEALEHIAASLRASVEAHLVADVPVATFLSAGLDSSMICSLVARPGVQPRTLTLAFAEFAGTANDESPLAEAIAKRFGTRHTTLTVRREDFEAERERLLAAMDQPSIDGVNTWFVARAAASQGIKVALSGLGGDELFGSYPSFRDVPRITRFARPFSHVPGLGLVVRKISAPLVKRLTSPKFAGLLEYGGTAGGAYLLRRGLYTPWELPDVMDPDMARQGWRELQMVARLNASAAVPGSVRLAVSALEMSWYMRHQLLCDADWAGMAHSVEIRVPLLDAQLLKETAPWFAAYPRLTKRQVVAATARDVPPELLDKPKTGFLVPVREWLGARPDARSGRGLRGWARTVHDDSTAPRAVTAATHGGPLSRRPRVLISTIAPGNGGVNAMTAFTVRTLADHGFEPVIAHYAPYSVMPSLSAPSFRLLWSRVQARRGLAHGGCETHAIGAWLPELEFTHYAATRHWRELMATCDAFIAASGSVLAATPFQQTGRPYVAWVATDWDGDRRDRVKHFPAVRRWLDAWVNAPVIRRLETKLLRGGRILSLSEHTARELARLAGPEFHKTLLPVPVDTHLFVPNPGARVPGRLGFAGRFTDPRKNIGLLLQAAALLRRQGKDVHVLLMGDSLSHAQAGLVAQLGMAEHVICKPGLSREAMRNWMQTLDVFVLPSHQEGLCIAALEAMACGVPVVSTRCGGPEEFVIEGKSGHLAGFDVESMAETIWSLASHALARAAASEGARRMAEERYRTERATAVLLQALHASFPAVDSDQTAVRQQRPAVAGPA
jgi:asparagine synthase (glutamine-hydrolysing)